MGPMLERTYPTQTCSIARTLEVVGERWSLLVLRDALFGRRRFDEFRASLGIASNVLAARLARLCSEGLLERRVYQTRPERHEYLLTEQGARPRPGPADDDEVGRSVLSQPGGTTTGGRARRRLRRTGGRPADLPAMRAAGRLRRRPDRARSRNGRGPIAALTAAPAEPRRFISLAVGAACG